MTYTHQDVLDAFDVAALLDCTWRESRGEPIDGQAAVAEVIMERWRDRRWPGTMHEVVRQPWQFSCYNPSDANRDLVPKRTSRSLLEAAEAVSRALNGSDMSGGANHYLNKAFTREIRGGSLPSWYDEDKVTAEIGRHVFLRL